MELARLVAREVYRILDLLGEGARVYASFDADGRRYSLYGGPDGVTVRSSSMLGRGACEVHIRGDGALEPVIPCDVEAVLGAALGPLRAARAAALAVSPEMRALVSRVEADCEGPNCTVAAVFILTVP